MNPSWENPARPCLFTLKAIEVEPFRRHGMHASDFFANTTREVDRELKGNGDISNIQGLRRFVLVHFFFMAMLTAVLGSISFAQRRTMNYFEYH